MVANALWRKISSVSLATAGVAACGFVLAIPFDLQVALFIRSLPEKVKSTFAVISAVSEPAVVLPLVACATVTLTLTSGRLETARLARVLGWSLVSAILALLLTLLSKGAIGRARPQVHAEMDPFVFKPFEGSYAYEALPSAQAAVVAAICLALASQAPASRFVIVPVAVLISLSRVVSERHWFSDVLAGWVVGGLATASALLVSRLVQNSRHGT